jgi:tetratricopeptide (TPR) repeat protein
MTQSQPKAESLFELGKLYTDRGDFFVAIDKLKEAATLFRESRNYPSFLKAVNLLLRLYAETEQQTEITKLKESIQDLVLKEGFELNSKTYYTLALCASYKGQDETALDYLQKALALGLAHDNKEDICYAVAGTALVYAGLGKYNEALKEIYNLQIFFQVLDIPEIRISSQILNGWILTQLGKYEQAIDVLWQTYELVRQNKTMTMHFYLLFNLGRAYLRSGDKEMARIYLTMAAKSVDPTNMKRLATDIKAELADLGDEGSMNYDLIFDIESHTVHEKKLGKVDFKNQFILLDLLKLFAQNQGKVYSKEFLVEHVWKQSYDPAVHDNKIYVTIKRLRKLIEPDYDKPKYIFRAKNGYFMNKSARVMVDKNEEKLL